MPKYQIRINGLPIDRSKFIKALRLTGHLGLKQALDLTVHFERFMHSILVAGIDLPVAEHIAGALRDAGADVELQRSSVSTPMLCTPQVNAKYTWSALYRIKRAS
jgi:hypothetical protein